MILCYFSLIFFFLSAPRKVVAGRGTGRSAATVKKAGAPGAGGPSKPRAPPPARMRTMTLAPEDDAITKATKAMGTADPVNKSFAERMKLFKKVESGEGEEGQGGEEEGVAGEEEEAY